MSRKSQRDTDRTTEKVDKVHTNVRESADGVEKSVGSDGGRPATGLIGNGEMTDPRYVAQR